MRIPASQFFRKVALANEKKPLATGLAEEPLGLLVKRGSTQRADADVEDLTVVDEQKSGHGVDVERPGQRGLSCGVDLDEPDRFVRELVGYRFEVRGHQLAGTTRRRPEVDDGGAAVFAHEAFEVTF